MHSKSILPDAVPTLVGPAYGYSHVPHTHTHTHTHTYTHTHTHIHTYTLTNQRIIVVTATPAIRPHHSGFAAGLGWFLESPAMQNSLFLTSASLCMVTLGKASGHDKPFSLALQFGLGAALDGDGRFRFFTG